MEEEGGRRNTYVMQKGRMDEGREGGRERERETETDRQRQGQRDRQIQGTLYFRNLSNTLTVCSKQLRPPFYAVFTTAASFSQALFISHQKTNDHKHKRLASG